MTNAGDASKESTGPRVQRLPTAGEGHLRTPTGRDVRTSPSKADSSSEKDARALGLLTLTFSLLR